MTVTFRDVGTWAEFTADGSVAIPGGTQTGDLMIVLATWKQYDYTAQITTPAGWNEIAEYNDGTVGAGPNVGSNKVGAWYKIHSGSESNPTLDWSTNPIPGTAVIIVFQKSRAEWAAPTFTTAAISAATDWTATGAADLSLAGGDALLCLVGFRDDSSTMTRGATNLTATGITWTANYVESPATHFSTTTSNDISADAGYRLASSGTSSAAPTAAGTLSASETGAALFLRIRDQAGARALEASSSAVSGSTSAIVRQRSFAGSAAAIATTSSQAATTRAISSSAVAVSGDTSDLTVQAGGTLRDLESTSAATSTSSAALEATRLIVVLAAATSGSSAVVAADRPIVGTSATISGSSEALAVDRPIAAISAAVSGSTSEIGRVKSLESSAQVTSGSTAALAADRSAQGALSATSDSVAETEITRGVTGASVAFSTAAATALAARSFETESAALSGAQAELSIQGQVVLAANSAAAAGTTASVGVARPFAASVVAQSVSVLAPVAVARDLGGLAAALGGSSSALSVEGAGVSLEALAVALSGATGTLVAIRQYVLEIEAGQGPLQEMTPRHALDVQATEGPRKTIQAVKNP